ncbi:cytochrome c family protein, partial [bacterium]|nr:cytochrome c family protein [bacterium]
KGQNTWQEGQAVKKCKECHDPVAKKGKVMKLQNAFHKNCKTCHIEVTKGGKKAPNKICKECHQKKS